MRSNAGDAGQEQFDWFPCLDDQMTGRIGVTVEDDRGSLNAVELIDRHLKRRNLRCLIGSMHKRRGDDRAAHQHTDKPKLDRKVALSVRDRQTAELLR